MARFRDLLFRRRYMIVQLAKLSMVRNYYSAVYVFFSHIEIAILFYSFDPCTFIALYSLCFIFGKIYLLLSFISLSIVIDLQKFTVTKVVALKSKAIFFPFLLSPLIVEKGDSWNNYNYIGSNTKKKP